MLNVNDELNITRYDHDHRCQRDGGQGTVTMILSWPRYSIQQQNITVTAGDDKYPRSETRTDSGTYTVKNFDRRTWKVSQSLSTVDDISLPTDDGVNAANKTPNRILHYETAELTRSGQAQTHRLNGNITVTGGTIKRLVKQVLTLMEQRLTQVEISI